MVYKRDSKKKKKEHGASIGEEDEDGSTAFQIASTKGYSDIIELLSERGAK